MDFERPESGDFVNAGALNGAFLRLLLSEPAVAAAVLRGADDVRERLAGLSTAQAGTLAAAPFLLFSFREREIDFWEAVLQGGQSNDLFRPVATPSRRYSRLVAAGLGFVWQLAQRNPYAARLICGASLHWCERITETTICELLACTSNRSDVLTLRFRHDRELWRKLTHAGTSRERLVRDAAHVSALQTVLTRTDSMRGNRLSLAARSAGGSVVQRRGEAERQA